MNVRGLRVPTVLCLAFVFASLWSPALAILPEVSNVQMTKTGSIQTLSWNSLGGSAGYHVYRGTALGLRTGNYGSCLLGSAQSTSVSITQEPPVGTAYVYLVSGFDETAEGSLGSRNPTPRCTPARRVFTLTQNGNPGDGVVDGIEPRQNPSILPWNASYGETGIYLHTGEFFVHATDLIIPGRGLDWAFVRSYRSQIAYDGPLGYGWDFNWNARLSASGSNVLYFDGTGRRETFTRTGPTTFSSPAGMFSTLTQNGDGSFTLRAPDGGVTGFHALDGTNLQGVLQNIADRFGNSLTAAYDNQGLLTSVTDTVGRLITLQYDAATGRLSSFTDFSGRMVVFTTISGDLIAVRSPVVTGTPNGNNFPFGKTTHYAYSSGFVDPRANHNLTTITSPKEFSHAGGPAVQNTYGTNSGNPQFDRVISQAVGGIAGGFSAGGIQTLSYISLFPGRQADLVDRNGNTKTFVHNAAGNLISRTEFTNRDVRPGEGDYFTIYSHNADGLLTGETKPRGNMETCLYDSGNPRRVSQANLLECRLISNGIGGGGADLVTRYTYDPVFNQCRTVTDPRAFPSGIVPLDVNGHLDLSDTLVARYTTTRFIDYQEEAGFQTAQGVPAMEQIPEGLGDLNGVADFNEGNVVKVVFPTIQTPGPNLGQTASALMTYNAFGQLLNATDPEGHVTARAYFPATGYLSSVTKDSGGLNLMAQYAYDSVGNVIQVIDPKLQDTLLTVNSLNQVVRRRSRIVFGSTRYQTDTFYDENENIVRVERQNLKEDGSAYAHNPLVDTKEYDILDDLRAENQDKSLNDNSMVGSVRTEYFLDANQSRTAIKLPLAVNGVVPANIITTLHDERDLVYKVTTGDDDTDAGNVPPSGTSIITRNYDPNRNLIETIDTIRNAQHSFAPTTAFPGSGYGDVIKRDHDGFDRLVKTTDGEGNERTIGYDLASHAIQATLSGPVDHTATVLSLLMQTDTTFDERNRAVLEDKLHFATKTGISIGDGHKITQTKYDRDGKVTEVTDDRGLKTTTQWDAADRKLKVIDQLTNELELAYDANSNLITTTRRDKSTDLGSGQDTYVTSEEYDGEDRLVKVTDNAGDVSQYFYDSRSNRVKTSDAVRGAGQPAGPGNIVLFDHDALDRLVKSQRLLTSSGKGDGSSLPLETIETRQAWNDDSLLVSQTDDNNHVTGYTYDDQNRLIAITYADGTAWTRLFDSDDHVTQWTDQNGTVVSMNSIGAHDGLDRILSRGVTPGSGVIGSTSENFGYDGAGRLTYAANNDGVTGTVTSELEYDSLSNRTKDQQGGLSVDVVADAVSNRTEVTYPGQFGGGRRALMLNYDQLNRLQSVSDASGRIATMHYKGPLRLERRTYGTDGAPISKLDLTYDLQPRGIVLNHTTGAGGQIARFEYGYDRMNHRLYEKRVHDSNAGDVYRYDSSYRVILNPQNINLLSVLPGTEIDPDVYASASNRLEIGFDGVGNRVTSNQVVSGVSTITSYSQVPGGSVKDAEVNQYTSTQEDSLPAKNYTYDSNGNLISDGAKTYGFDFKNRLVEVRDQSTSNLIAQYSHDALDRRRMKLIAGGPTTQYLYDRFQVVEERDETDAITRQYVWGAGIDNLLQEQTPTATYYSHENSIGSIVALSGVTANVLERYRYDPFGNTTLPLDGATGNRMRFHGAYFDDETGLYYMRHRNYSPYLGRFIQRDPIGIWTEEINTGNGYSFVGNDEVNNKDPFGLQEAEGDCQSEYEKCIERCSQISSWWQVAGCMEQCAPELKKCGESKLDVGKIEKWALDFLTGIAQQWSTSLGLKPERWTRDPEWYECIVPVAWWCHAVEKACMGMCIDKYQAAGDATNLTSCLLGCKIGVARCLSSGRKVFTNDWFAINLDPCAEGCNNQ